MQRTLTQPEDTGTTVRRHCFQQHLCVVLQDLCKCRQKNLLILFSSSRLKLTRETTHPHSLLFTGTFADPLSISMASLPTTPAQIPGALTCSIGLVLASWSSLVCANKHAHSSHRHPVLVFPLKYQHGPPCLSDTCSGSTLAKGQTPSAHTPPAEQGDKIGQGSTWVTTETERLLTSYCHRKTDLKKIHLLPIKMD